MSQLFGGAGVGVAVAAGMIVTVSILSRRSFWTFAYIAIKVSPTRMAIINLTPVRGARERSAAPSAPFEDSTSGIVSCFRVSRKPSVKRKRRDRVHDALTESRVNFSPRRLEIGGGKIDWFAYYHSDWTDPQSFAPAR